MELSLFYDYQGQFFPRLNICNTIYILKCPWFLYMFFQNITPFWKHHSEIPGFGTSVTINYHCHHKKKYSIYRQYIKSSIKGIETQSSPVQIWIPFIDLEFPMLYHFMKYFFQKYNKKEKVFSVILTKDYFMFVALIGWISVLKYVLIA